MGTLSLVVCGVCISLQLGIDRAGIDLQSELLPDFFQSRISDRLRGVCIASSPGRYDLNSLIHL